MLPQKSDNLFCIFFWKEKRCVAGNDPGFRQGTHTATLSLVSYSASLKIRLTFVSPLEKKQKQGFCVRCVCTSCFLNEIASSCSHIDVNQDLSDCTGPRNLCHRTPFRDLSRVGQNMFANIFGKISEWSMSSDAASIAFLQIR